MHSHFSKKKIRQFDFNHTSHFVNKNAFSSMIFVYLQHVCVTPVKEIFNPGEDTVVGVWLLSEQ